MTDKAPHSTAQTFTQTTQLRWLIRKDDYTHLHVGPNQVVGVPMKVLQQAWRGGDGSLRWEDIEEVVE